MPSIMPVRSSSVGVGSPVAQKAPRPVFERAVGVAMARRHVGPKIGKLVSLEGDGQLDARGPRC